MASKPKERDSLLAAVNEAGIDLFGATTAEPLPSSGSFRHTQPRELLPGARSIALAGYCISYEPRIVPSQPGKPRGRFTAYGSRVYAQMERHCIEVMSHTLEGLGFSAVGTDRIPLKPAVVRAGLGSYGKHSVTVTPTLGSMVMFACVVTDAPLDGMEESVKKTECPPRCSLCMEACPTGAITGPFIIDRALCITDWLWGTYAPPELRVHQKDRLFGCAECLLACPKNRSVPPKASYPVATDEIGDSPELIPLLTADFAYFKKVLPTFPLRAGLDALRGNAIIALGNIGDPAATEALGQTLCHRKPRLRAYSAWALGRIGTSDARARVKTARAEESDDAVIAEMENALA